MHRVTSFFEAAASFALGCGAAVVLQLAYSWWLNSGKGVLRTTLVLFTLAFLIAIWRSGAPWVRAVALWAGAVAGMTVMLFRIGPGNIWPIVLAMAASISAGAVFAGSWLGLAARTLMR